jgi:hypothetical protein
MARFYTSVMGRALGFIGLISVVAIGGYVYVGQIREVSPNGATSKTSVNVIGVHNDLMAIANAEKRYWVTHAKYAQLEELGSNGDIAVPTRPDYAYSTVAGDNNFTITATYTGVDSKAPRRLTIDETMTLSSE